MIPAYNEGPFVLKTLAAVVGADYPESKKQIVVIDDGSTDDTAASVRGFMESNPGAVEFVRFERNQGKREAMAEGVERATGEVIVFIDSDTVVEADALKYIVAPFVHPRIGARPARSRWRTGSRTSSPGCSGCATSCRSTSTAARPRPTVV